MEISPSSAGSGSCHVLPSSYHNRNFHKHIRLKPPYTPIDFHPFSRVSTYFYEISLYMFSSPKTPPTSISSTSFHKLPKHSKVFSNVCDFRRLPPTSLPFPSVLMEVQLPWKFASCFHGKIYNAHGSRIEVN